MIATRKILIVLLAAVVLSAGAAVTQAQRQTYRGTTTSVRQLILRIKNGTDVFQNNLSAMNQGRIYGTSGQNMINLAEDLDRAVVQLQERFNRRQSTAADAQEVLSRAAVIDQFMTGRNVRGAAVLRSWTNLRANLNQLATAYNVSWPTVGQTYPPNSYPNNGSYGSQGLTGTYRLDPSRSDDPAQVADRATRSVAYGNRAQLRAQLATRLESPEQIAIELRGRSVTLASSRAPQITFSADGVERVETTNGGRTIRARATLSGNQLTVSSTGDRATEFNVTFNPIENGRRMSVVRRVYVSGLSTPVVVQSTYDKISEVARFDINDGTQPYPIDNNPNTGFIVANGERVVVVLDNDLSTNTARDGDRFTATVRQPSQYEGATIEGHVSAVKRSGRISGRSEMTLTFDNIRLRDGRSYRFAGILESVTNTQGDIVKVDNEGAVRDDNQTSKTVERTAIGTAVGAIIGAIAGGGKGAAIGAIIGAGGGAGSVYAQGRDDLELPRGTELFIRATGPR